MPRSSTQWTRFVNRLRMTNSGAQRRERSSHRRARIEWLESREMLAAELESVVPNHSAAEEALVATSRKPETPPALAAKGVSILTLFDSLDNAGQSATPPTARAGHGKIEPLSLKNSDSSEMPLQTMSYSGGSGGSGGLPPVYLMGQYPAESVVTGEPLAAAAFSISASPVTVELHRLYGSNNGPMAVKMELGGTASPDDVRIFWDNQEVSVTNGQFSVNTVGAGIFDLKVQAVSDQLLEGTERLTIGIVDDPAYEIDYYGDDPVKIDILDGTYEGRTCLPYRDWQR